MAGMRLSSWSGSLHLPTRHHKGSTHDVSGIPGPDGPALAASHLGEEVDSDARRSNLGCGAPPRHAADGRGLQGADAGPGQPRAPAVAHRRHRRPWRDQPRHRGSRRHHAVRDAAALSQGGRNGAAQGTRHGADGRALRDVAARHGPHHAAGSRRLRHRLAQRTRRAARRRALRPRRIHAARHRLPGGDGSERQRHRRLPAVRGGAGRRGVDVRGPACRDAGEPDADDRTDRLPHQSDRGQQARRVAADRIGSRAS